MVMGGKITYGAPFQPALYTTGAYKLTISYRHRYCKVELQDPGAGTLTTALFFKNFFENKVELKRSGKLKGRFKLMSLFEALKVFEISH